MRDEFRMEADSMGRMKVPANAYYGAQTARAVENFPISELRFPREFVRALGLIKKHASVTNRRLGLLPEGVAHAIQTAAQEVIDGKLDGEFVVDVFQTGSGTSTNMNANEVIANRAIELLGGRRGDKTVHPNNHVNQGQSSNDVIPSALQIAALESLERRLLPALNQLEASLQAKARQFHELLKIGRTHLQDATPMRLGQEFGGYASQVSHAAQSLNNVISRLGELPLGGTAVGTGINTHKDFPRLTIEAIAGETSLRLVEASNHFEAQATIDVCVSASGALKALAVSLIKIANDIRWLGSGPRCGLGELRLPAVQPGSSIMPGKINPVICEAVIQAAAQVIGNDAVITFSGTFGALELNTMLPVAGYNLLQAISLLSSSSVVFAERCVTGLAANAEKCEQNIEQSLAMCTSLTPLIGYDAAAIIAKTAYESGRTVRQVALELSGLDRTIIEKALDPRRLTEPT